MGTFINVVKPDDVVIPEDKRQEFAERALTVFMQGGMLSFDKVSLYGKKIYMLKKPALTEDGFDTIYNYYEDDIWENAGLSLRLDRMTGKRECCIYSGKIGWNRFAIAAEAATTLQAYYLDGDSIAFTDDTVTPTHPFSKWFQYLFPEDSDRFPLAYGNAWDIFMMCHDIDEGYTSYDGWDWLLDGRIKTEAWLSGIDAVRNGTEAVISEAATDNDKNDFLAVNSGIKMIIEMLQLIDSSPLVSEDKKYDYIIEMIKTFISTGNDIDKFRETIHTYDKSLGTDIMSLTWHMIMYADLRAFLIKYIAEKYDRDFFELWNSLGMKDVSCDYLSQKKKYGKPSNTRELFKITPEDMLYILPVAEMNELADDTKAWFSELKAQYDELMKDEDLKPVDMKQVMDVLDYAEDNYHYVFVFSDFFEETIGHTADKKYAAYWKIFENIVRDEQNLVAAAEMFARDDDGKFVYSIYGDKVMKSSWEFMSREMKYNSGRTKVRSYLALMANRELRERVLG